MTESPEVRANRELWDKLAAVHVTSKFYDVAGFLAGKDSLNEIEVELLGDLRGQTVLHLQCHFGLDSLSMARRGAKVTGVDFSSVAIANARELNARAQLDATFVQSDVNQLDQVLAAQFDLVFASFGIVGWHADLDRWARIVARFLKPGGRFCFAEFHPVRWMLSDDFSRIQYAYFQKDVIVEENTKSYAEPGAGNCGTAYGWNHSLGEVFGALERQGLRISHFKEYDYMCSGGFQNAVEIDGKFYVKGLEHMLPLMYSLIAQKT
jgi:ubiquinone/menaquinone biosynthesis C-methylase UbiE